MAERVRRVPPSSKDSRVVLLCLQACEFDYSGTQACKSLRCAAAAGGSAVMACLCFLTLLSECTAVLSLQVRLYYTCALLLCRQEGYRVILLNSNPVSSSASSDTSRNSSGSSYQQDACSRCQMQRLNRRSRQTVACLLCVAVYRVSDVFTLQLCRSRGPFSNGLTAEVLPQLLY